MARIGAEEAPEAVVAALEWIGRKSVDISALNTPTVVRSALDALTRKMDGTAAADNTVNRKVPVFSNCLRYAVELDRLSSLPLTKVDLDTARDGRRDRLPLRPRPWPAS